MWRKSILVLQLYFATWDKWTGNEVTVYLLLKMYRSKITKYLWGYYVFVYSLWSYLQINRACSVCEKSFVSYGWHSISFHSCYIIQEQYIWIEHNISNIYF